MSNSYSFFFRFWQTRARLRQVRANPARLLDGAPKVSVMVITYNHGTFIGQALDSILMQERAFGIEINVIDDASTDHTQEVVRAYQARYPGIINCFFNETNVGKNATQLNTIRGFRTLRGEYFCLLEGDDYWTDKHKLAKQIAFLDENKDYVACAHWTQKVFQDCARPPEHFLPFLQFGRKTADIKSVIHLAAVYHLSSTVYRNLFQLEPPLCFADPYSCEATINMMYASHGLFYCFDEYMSAYRVHSGGQFSVRSQEWIWRFHLNGFIRFMLYLGPQYWSEFTRAMIGFSRWILFSEGRRKVAPHLTIGTRIIFSCTFLMSSAAYAPMLIVRTFCLFADVLRGEKNGLRRLYSFVLEHLPDPFIRAYLAVEARSPRFQAKRRSMVSAFKDIQK